MGIFKIKSKFKPAGDQPKAISSLKKGLDKSFDKQTLLGVTGSGKTFTMANVLSKEDRPTLVIAHNKTLAAQLTQEYKEFFPENKVCYFVSYYDYYQPEAYVPVTDTYIEKEAQINAEIERLRHEATQALLTRKDVIVVASVSCIYGLGSPIEYEKVNFKIKVKNQIPRRKLIEKLVSIYFERTNADLKPGYFRVLGDTVEIMPVNEKIVYRVEIKSGKVDSLRSFDPVSMEFISELDSVFIFPAHHFVTPKDEINRALGDISAELENRLSELKKEGKNLEAERLKRRTKYDMAMIREVGYCSGIENYSRHFSAREEGEAPDTLLSYFPKDKNGKPDFLTIIDESHVTLSQIAGMYAGDASRKGTLIEHGFRLPSAKDNRPLTYDEFEKRIGQVTYTSATPGNYEIEESKQVVEQIIRPTGLVDPKLEVRPVISQGENKGQVNDLIDEIKKEVEKGGRVIATTLTKRMSEDLSEYLKEKGIKAEYLHSEIKTIDRIGILSSFRKGDFDCLVGVNLLREGLDLPEVSLIGILDADKEGFLRSETSLIQTIGRAARNVDGRVILYADKITGSLKYALNETERRRKIQVAYNKKHSITPKSIEKSIHDITETLEEERKRAVKYAIQIDKQSFGGDIKAIVKEKEKLMEKAVKELDFETAAILRDEIKLLESESGG